MVTIRRAAAADVPTIVELLADDVLGRTREQPADLAPYDAAFAEIDADPDELLLVAEAEGTIVGTLQVSFVRRLSRRGALRAQIESVRVAESARGSGVGAALMTYALDRARDRGCGIAELTSDKARPDAHRFYERLGFVASHEGFKRAL
jgi:GNAT superfamily N-acetyltransferase